MIPGSSSLTVDGEWGFDDIKSFYDSNPYDFTLTLRERDESDTTYTVVITDFQYSLEKRWGDEYYNASMELTEV